VTGRGLEGAARLGAAPDRAGRLLAAGATVLLLLAVAPQPGFPHASLVRSAPARRAILVSAPTRVQLWFSERLEGEFSRLSVWDATGRQVDSRDVQVDAADPKKLSVGLPALAAGAYVVRFRVLSVDGHIVEAEFPFTVRPAPPAAGRPARQP
jgi:methionine-rich copper-binding protein CopC